MTRTGGGEPRVTAITQSGDDKINIGDRDDTKLAIAADLTVKLSDFTNFLRYNFPECVTRWDDIRWLIIGINYRKCLMRIVIIRKTLC